jgi:hypothetical protein
MVSTTSKGFELVSDKPLKYKDKCIILCPKGHPIETSWRDIKKKLESEGLCNNCYMIKKMSERAKEKGYISLSDEWNGYTAEYSFLCPNNHEQTYVWKYFNDHDGNHCTECYNQRVLDGKHNATSEEFKQLQKDKLLNRMSELGYTLDQESYNYVTNKDRIKMICSNSHKYEVEYAHFMQGKKCRKCGYDNWRLSEEEVKSELESMGYTYLGEYHRIDEPLKYICTCGHITRKRLTDLRKGQKCIRCAKKYTVENRRNERMKLIEQEFKK